MTEAPRVYQPLDRRQRRWTWLLLALGGGLVAWGIWCSLLVTVVGVGLLLVGGHGLDHRAAQAARPVALWSDRFAVVQGALNAVHPFASILEVRVRPQSLTVVLPLSIVRIDGRLEGYADLRDRLLAAVPERAAGPADQTEVTPEELESWLGVEPGERLVCRPRRWHSKLIPAAVPLWLLFPLALCPESLNWLEKLLVLVVSLGGCWLWRAPEVSADRHGLRFGRGRRVVRAPWSELLDLEGPNHPPMLGDERRWTVVTCRGDFTLGDSLRDIDRLVEAIRQALRATKRGEALPPDVNVPDGAISLVRLTEPEIDRGISVVRGEGEDG